MSLGKKDPAKKYGGEPALRNPHKPGTKEWEVWNNRNKKEEEPAKKKEKKKEETKSAKAVGHQVSKMDKGGVVKKKKGDSQGRVPKRHGARHTTIGEKIRKSPHEMTLKELFNL